MHTNPRMHEYIDTEVSRPCKEWAQEVINSKRETVRVRLRTQHYVLLPDIETNYKRTCCRIGIKKNSMTNGIGSGLSECPILNTQTSTSNDYKTRHCHLNWELIRNPIWNQIWNQISGPIWDPISHWQTTDYTSKVESAKNTCPSSLVSSGDRY